MLPFATATSTGSRRPSVPPSPMSCRITPCQEMNSARVTTNDGMPSFATRKPVSTPITTPTQTASSISNQAFGGKPTRISTSPRAPKAAPAQIRSQTASATASAMIATKATNTVLPIAPSRLPLLTWCSASTAAASPDAVPAARSISPMSSTNTRPIAMTVWPAPCWSRLARFSRLGKVPPLSSTVNSTNSASRPSSAGREPSSPLRRFCT